jgi:predicted metalloprotease with PDZ domain
VSWHFRRSFRLQTFLSKIALMFVLGGTFASASRATILYDISLDHPERHTFTVRMWIPNVNDEVVVRMPAWNALYQIRDFSSHVREVTAHIGSQAAMVEKIDKQSWRVSGTGIVTISYSSYWDEPGPFASQLNSEHAFINPAMVLMYVADRRSEDVSLSVSHVPDDWQASEGNLIDHFHVHSPEDDGKRAFAFPAVDYDHLVDTPIEVAKFEQFDLPGIAPPVSVVVHGDKWKKKEMEEELRRICSYEVKLMDGAPYRHYTFIFHFGEAAGGAGGGMEHADSTAISLRSAEQLPNIAAHEFFHLWNVKRIRPETLVPVDYTKEQYTRALWFAEGVTSTYAAYAVARTQLWSKEQFYSDLSQQISELEARPANRWQSAEESSLDAWLEKYPLYNRPQESVSYYAKGQVLGVLLDTLIRDRSDNQKSLDDVLRAMNNDFAKKNKPYRDSLDVRLTAERIAGGSFEEFFRKYVSHAEAIPYSQMLALGGWDLRTAQRKRPAIGFFTERGPAGEVIIRNVDPDSSAAQAGLRSGDVILSWNGAEPPRSVERWSYSQKPGNVVHAKVLRDDRELNVEFRIDEVSETYYQVVEDPNATAKAKRIREGILRGSTQPVAASTH